MAKYQGLLIHRLPRNFTFNHVDNFMKCAIEQADEFFIVISETAAKIRQVSLVQKSVIIYFS